MAKKKFLDEKFFRQLSKDVIPMYRRHIFLDAKDIDGKTFPNYKEPYKTLKATNKLPRQDAASAGSTAPYVSGDLMRDFKLIKKPNNKGFSFGTTSYGGRVNNLSKKKRVISRDNKPLPDKISNFVMKSVGKYVFEEVLRKEFKGKTIRIKL